MSRDTLSAVGLPDATLEVWTDETTATQAGPRAGIPEPTADSMLRLSASGQQTAPIEVMTLAGGHPTRDASGSLREVMQSASLAWRPPGGVWRGWDPPRALSRWEPLLLEAGGSGYAIDPDVLVLDSGVVCVACEERVSGASGPWRVIVRRRAGDGEAWATVVVESFDLDPGYNFRPTIVALPTGRIQLYRYLARGAYSALRWWYSDDDGATWSWGGDGALDESIRDDSGDGPARMRVRYSRGQLLLVAWLADVDSENVLTQYASSDLGNHFQRVAVVGASTSPSFPDDPDQTFDVAPIETGGFVVAVGNAIVAGRVHALVVPDAYRSLADATRVAVDAAATRALVARDESGVLLLLAGEAGASGTLWRAYGSADGGLTWSAYYQGQSAPALGGSINTLGVVMAADPALACGRGRAHMAHRWVGGSYSWGASLGMIYLGGWATVTQPQVRSSESDYDSVGWYAYALPFARPDDYTAFTRTGTGTTGYAAGASVLVAGSGAAEIYTLSLSALAISDSDSRWTSNRASAWRIVGRVTSGGDITTDRCGMRIATADSAAADRCDVSIRMEPGTWRVWDHIAGAQVGADVTHATTADVEILVVIEHLPQRVVRTYWRLRTNDEDRAYEAGPTGTIALGTSGLQTVRYGIIATGPAAATMRLAEFAAGPQIVQGGARYAPTLTTEYLAGRSYAGRPYIARGAYLTARQGSTWRGEVWRVDPRPDYGLARAVLDSSARTTWRSTGTGAQSISLRWTSRRSAVLAIAVRGSNVPRLDVDTWSGTAWVPLGVAVLAAPYAHTRSGAVLSPAGTRAGYLSHGELVGGYASLSGTIARRIIYQPEGLWSPTGTARIHLEGVDSGDPASGTAQAVYPDALILIDLRGLDTTAVRLSIPSAGTHIAPPESYWEVGCLAARWLWPVGSDYAWGDTLDEETHIEGTWTRDRQWRGVRVAPASRRVGLSFESVFELSVDTYPHAVALGGSAVARQATARALAAYLREVDGPAGSLLWVPDAGDLPSPVTVQLGRGACILGRLAEARVTRTTKPGSRKGSEAVDVGQIVIEEDP